jgi:phosphoribosylformylglycinamidine synthase subunit PurSL
MPADPLVRYRLLHQAIQQGLVESCHDLSEGGLAVALAEMALAGRLGADVEIGSIGDKTVEAMAAAEVLFSESNGRLLIEVAPENAAALEAHFQDQVLISLGRVTDDGQFVVYNREKKVIELTVQQLVDSWKV